MALKWKDKRDVCMLSSTHNEEMQTVSDKKGGEKRKPKVCTDYSDAMGSVDLSDQYIVMYSTTRRMKKYYQKIFCHLLDLTLFSLFVTFIVGGRYTHLQFHMHIVHKLFEKYGGATPSEAVLARAIRTSRSFWKIQREAFPDVNPPIGTRKHASKRCVICICKKEWKDTK
jgi:hypothetical protein